MTVYGRHQLLLCFSFFLLKKPKKAKERTSDWGCAKDRISEELECAPNDSARETSAPALFLVFSKKSPRRQRSERAIEDVPKTESLKNWNVHQMTAHGRHQLLSSGLESSHTSQKGKLLKLSFGVRSQHTSGRTWYTGGKSSCLPHRWQI